MLFSRAAAPIYIPTNSARGFPFSTSSPMTVISCLCLSLIRYLKWHLGATEIIGPGISLEGMMLKLKLQYFGHLM